MSRGLPHGRGYLNDPVAQNQEWARRSRENPKANGWIVSRSDWPGMEAVVNAAPAEDVVHMTPIARLTVDFTPHKAMTYVSDAGGGATILAAIYRYSDRRFTLVPGTNVTFTVTGTGAHEANTPTAQPLLAGVQYFIGSYVTASGTFASSTLTHTTMPFGFLKLTASELASSYERAAFTVDTSEIVPWISWLSKEAYEVLV